MNHTKTDASPDKSNSPDFLSTIGMLAASPLLMIGLFSQTMLSLHTAWYLQFLAVFSFILGIGGLLVALSKVRKGIIYGAAMITAAALLSVLFAMSTDVLKETPDTALIITGAIVAAICGLFHYFVYHYKPKSE